MTSMGPPPALNNLTRKLWEGIGTMAVDWGMMGPTHEWVSGPCWKALPWLAVPHIEGRGAGIKMKLPSSPALTFKPSKAFYSTKGDNPKNNGKYMTSSTSHIKGHPECYAWITGRKKLSRSQNGETEEKSTPPKCRALRMWSHLMLFSIIWGRSYWQVSSILSLPALFSSNNLLREVELFL
jgi:hypothetical protein